ncbi:acyl-ACP--UDP-N-acetylglucosamine O-acyltransferase [Paraburkholderia sp. NMBU_R16]|uniref:acyl-ACP--UDP-N-acetylglucosamine O-acyltransferase n=1 Tax=Paraburkholderia sp. NMBU_R16 TaxID=2698676 RepID=UPI00156467E0|nr:acyl-ACP--UDP-N-acetylglucosamine O-acyltransferase [Paraburkholderia sp. NMBU_R16]NRO97723.1 acyl-ACP--UDP-N-acetylglucosamine O-acyltransferase [Paraburkholderia sp. NMBU_R16]
MSRIHPTAIIESGAELADEVEIGPYAIVGPNVTIGAGTVIGSHSVIEGHTTIGAANRIGHYASIGGRPQDMKYQGEPTRLVIGDRNTIREFTTIHTGTVQDGGVTTIGDDNWIMAYVHIGHDCHVGSNTILSSNAQMAGHVIVGDWAIVGGMSGVHQFVRIGEHSMLGGASALVQDIPPFVIAAGNKAEPHGINVEGLRRRGFSADAISALRGAYRLLYKNGLSLEEAKTQLGELAAAGGDGDEHVRKLIAFIDASQRGIIR